MYQEFRAKRVLVTGASWITGHSFAVDGGMLSRIDMPRRPRPEPPVEPERVTDTAPNAGPGTGLRSFHRFNIRK